MAQNPKFIDLGPTPSGPFYNGIATPRGMPSPRLHLAGDVPPSLSPLDALQVQSRLLAKQLQESANRESRLPPLTISNALSQPRPGYLRSASADDADESIGPSTKPDVLKPEFRPKSVYPQLSTILAANRDSVESSSVPNLASPVNFPQFGTEDEIPRGRRPGAPSQDFGAQRTQSPAPIVQNGHHQHQAASYFPPRQSSGSSLPGLSRGLENSNHGPNSASYFPPPRPSGESTRQQSLTRPSIDSSRHQSQSRPSAESIRQQSVSRASVESPRERSQSRLQHQYLVGHDARGLVPPRSPFAQKTPSIRSVSVDSEEDIPMSMGQSVEGHRKLSTSSGLSSPMSPFVHPAPRSPSICSDFSANGSRLSRPHFNFSRPLSRASEAAFDLPSRQASGDSQPSFVFADDTVHTPISLQGDDFPESGAGAPSYVYSRFSLPRGKLLQRNSKIFQDGPGAELPWDEPIASQSNVRPFATKTEIAPPSPPSRPATSSASQSTTITTPDIMPRRSEDTGNTRAIRSAELSRADPAGSISSGGTIKAKSQLPTAAVAEGSAEFHLAKGIECHERGSVNESTYHLRIAARKNHPTGMLLYALACRHGWGMRANQREGVQWLRKAAEHAQLEVADDEETVKGGKNVDFMEQKTRKAQFALSIYELGVSHMNGWGIEQDKVLALRCFEIAGSWGDGDALAEAGFCYAQGVGCKKDLKKSAKFYRMAETKGISMVGNSWIYKKKYQDDSNEVSTAQSAKSATHAASTSSPEKKMRDKSRTRTMFGRMKSNQ